MSCFAIYNVIEYVKKSNLIIGTEIVNFNQQISKNLFYPPLISNHIVNLLNKQNGSTIKQDL